MRRDPEGCGLSYFDREGYVEMRRDRSRVARALARAPVADRPPKARAEARATRGAALSASLRVFGHDEHDRRGTDLKLRFVLQLERPFDLLPVHERAVGRAEVFEQDDAVAHFDR